MRNGGRWRRERARVETGCYCHAPRIGLVSALALSALLRASCFVLRASLLSSFLLLADKKASWTARQAGIEPAALSRHGRQNNTRRTKLLLLVCSYTAPDNESDSPSLRMAGGIRGELGSIWVFLVGWNPVGGKLSVWSCRQEVHSSAEKLKGKKGQREDGRRPLHCAHQRKRERKKQGRGAKEARG